MSILLFFFPYFDVFLLTSIYYRKLVTFIIILYWFQRIIVWLQLIHIVFYISWRYIIVGSPLLVGVTIFINIIVFLVASHYLILVECLDLWVQLSAILGICLVLFDCLDCYFEWLVVFLFCASYRTCRIHRPRCIYIPPLYFILVQIVNRDICFFILLVILYFHTLAETSYSFYAFLFL